MKFAIHWRLAVAAITMSLAVWACTGAGDSTPTAAGEGPGAAAATDADLVGGTLRVGACCFTGYQMNRRNFLDPQAPFSVANAQREFLRCCLTRTLLSYTGRSTAEGGTTLHPDLATGLPIVSDDGLTWTFHLKEGIQYAPPLADVEITTPDIVRAIERAATPAVATEEYVAVFEPIEGVREFADGEASTISGLETPDRTTLRVHLTEVTNDLGYRFALPATAPIPPSPADPSARFGAAEGHDGNYGYFLISSGPYMIEGSEDLEPELPPREQPAVSGLVRGEFLTLVRSPSWSRETDELRKAYVDRIEVRVVERRDGARAVEQGSLDVVIDSAPTTRQLERYLDDPELRDRVVGEGCNFTSFASMRLAAPPFDDVHVRRAVNYAFNREEAARLSTEFEWSFGVARFHPVTHIAPDSTQAALLADWNPYPFDLGNAREEMAKSRYDEDGDGNCDHASCDGIVTLDSSFGPEREIDRLVWERGLREIGITLDVRQPPYGRLVKEASDPQSEALLVLMPFWEAEYPSPARLFESAFGAAGIGSEVLPNFSLVGASADQLAAWGYPTTTVPSVDTKIDECDGLLGPAQQQCWAELDQLLMLQIVPAVPNTGITEVRIVSERVARYSVDQPFGAYPALDQIALVQGEE